MDPILPFPLQRLELVEEQRNAIRFVSWGASSVCGETSDFEHKPCLLHVSRRLGRG